MTDLPKPELIIFDVDGTICDTEIVWSQCMADVFSRYGPELSVEDAGGRYNAQTMHSVIDKHRALPGVAFPDDIFEILNGNFMEKLAAHGPKCAVNGANECIIACAKVAKVAVATNGEIEGTKHKLTHIGLLDLMPDIKSYTKDVVTNPKPAPDLFLYVAKEFGVAPQDCWVIEDSVTGVTAGVTAGMTAIGYVGCAHDKDAARQALLNAGAQYVFEDYKDFPLAF